MLVNHRSLKLVSLDSSVGIDPLSWLLYRSRYASEVRRERASGRGPDLMKKKNKVKKLKPGHADELLTNLDLMKDPDQKVRKTGDRSKKNKSQ